MTLTVTPTPPVPGDALPVVEYASWVQRVVAALLDGAILSGATWLVLGTDERAPSLTPALSGSSAGHGVSWGSSPVLVALVVVLLVLQGYTGATPGKRVVGIAVVRASTGRPVGLLASALRVVAHLLDAILLIGYLRPLWDAQRRTFADSIVGTVVLRTRRPTAHAWFAGRGGPTTAGSALVTAGAAAACALGVGFSVTSTSGGWDTAADVPCAADVGSVLASASASRETSWTQEHRLWVTRPLARGHGDQLSIAWQWYGHDGGDRADPTAVRTELLDASGAVVTTVEQDLAERDWATAGVAFEPATLSTSDLAHAGEGWSVRSRLEVEGTAVASCTVGDDDWTATG